MPFGYYVDSMSYGVTDLTQGPIVVTRSVSSDQIHVVLTTSRPPGTAPDVTVRGSVKELPADAADSTWVRLQSVPPNNPELPSNIRVGQAPVQPDGTFEIHSVPPGTYVMGLGPVPSPTVQLEVGDEDVDGVEIPASAPANSVVVAGNSGLRPGSADDPVPPPGKGLLAVTQSGQGQAYREGAITFFSVMLAERTVAELRLDRGSRFVMLDPGPYEIRSYVRPCDGNCLTLDPPRDECRTQLTLGDGVRLTAERVQSSASCALRILRR